MFPPSPTGSHARSRWARNLRQLISAVNIILSLYSAQPVVHQPVLLSGNLLLVDRYAAPAERDTPEPTSFLGNPPRCVDWWEKDFEFFVNLHRSAFRFTQVETIVPGSIGSSKQLKYSYRLKPGGGT